MTEIGEGSTAGRPNVVFDTSAEAGHRTQVIDIERLDSVLGSSREPFGPDPVGALPADALASTREPQIAEPGDLLRLFTSAAETLMFTDSLDETLERILGLVFDNLPAERGVICLYDELRDHSEPMVMRTREGATDEPITISENITRDVIQRRQSLLVHDTAMDERFGGADSVILMQIRSAMCAPLYREGKVVGLHLRRQPEWRSAPFAPAHLQTLSALALLSAVAVEKAHAPRRRRARPRHPLAPRALQLSRRRRPDRPPESRRPGRQLGDAEAARLDRHAGATEHGEFLGEDGLEALALAGAADSGATGAGLTPLQTDFGSGTQGEMVARECEVTVLFADLTSFTSMSEALGADARSSRC